MLLISCEAQHCFLPAPQTIHRETSIFIRATEPLRAACDSGPERRCRVKEQETREEVTLETSGKEKGCMQEVASPRPGETGGLQTKGT